MSGEGPVLGGAQPPVEPSAGASIGAGRRDVFISYASQDKAVAEAVCDALERAGVACWIAPRDVTPGAFYADAIVRALNEARLLVLVLTADAIASPHVLREVERTSAKRHAIVSLRLAAVSLPPALEYFLSASHWLDASASGVAGALPKLVEAVRRLAAPDAGLDPGRASEAVAPAVDLLPDRSGTTRSRRPNRPLVAVIAMAAAVLAAVVVARFWFATHAAGPPPAATVAPAAAAPAAAPSVKSIAVLPFADMSERRDQEYFSDGMADEVLDLLARVPGIRVIGRTSSFQFKGKSEDLRAIGARLGAAYLVDGSVRKSGERLRVTAQLVTAGDGSRLWSDSYEAASGDVFQVQDQIAAALVRALQVTIGADDLRSRPMKSAEAYELYLRGRHAYDRFDKAGFENAASYFRQALAQEPTAVRAAEWLALTEESSAEFGFVPPRDGFERARESTLDALTLDPRSALAHANMCAIHTIYDWDWVQAANECRIALAIEPRNSLVLATAGQAMVVTDQIDGGARLLTEALTLDPMVASSHVLFGNNRRRIGRHAEAEAEFRKALDISPQYVAGHYYLALALLAQGRVDAARSEMLREVADGGRDVGLAIVDYARGNTAESDRDIARAPADWAYWLAGAYAYRGDAGRAVTWLDRAYRDKDVDLCFINSEPIFDRVRTDPRFKAFVRKLKLPER